MSVIVVGSVALDTVKTPDAEQADLLGGSASYAAVAASFYSPVNLIGVVGEDFPARHLELFKARGVNLDGLESVQGGSTFRWSGEYFDDLNTRETRDVALNVLENFRPKLAGHQKGSRIVLLANCAPATQMEVLDQCENPDFVIADTMDLWIQIAHDDLLALLKRVDLLILNDSEAKMLTATNNLITSGYRLRDFGPKNVIVKKGEHGALLFGEKEFFTIGAYPLQELHDPTGAGDTFAGGIAGYLAKYAKGEPSFKELVQALVHGTILASFTCESFSTRRLEELTSADIEKRYAEFRNLTHFAE